MFDKYDKPIIIFFFFFIVLFVLSHYTLFVFIDVYSENNILLSEQNLINEKYNSYLEQQIIISETKNELLNVQNEMCSFVKDFKINSTNYMGLSSPRGVNCVITYNQTDEQIKQNTNHEYLHSLIRLNYEHFCGGGYIE